MGELTNDTESVQLEYGLRLPKGIKPRAALGLRTITNDSGMIDIVPNRLDFYGTPEDRSAIAVAFNSALPDIKKEYLHCLTMGTMKMNRSDRVRLHTGTNFFVEGNTNGSFGYLYLIAWME